MPVKSSTSPVPEDPAAVRPLPQPTLASAEFWSAGSDGVLRVLRCADCGAYTHPPLPRCRSCRGDRVTMSPVSGRGVVAGFTVNHQQWLPDFPPPYVIAVVALEEDDGVRLTTNIVGCPADQSAHRDGRPGAVREGRRRLPARCSSPTPRRRAKPWPSRPIVTSARPVQKPKKRSLRNGSALTGVGQSRVGRRLMVDPLTLTVDACLAAVADAGLTLDDIDGLSTYPSRVGSPGFSEGGIAPLTEALQLRPTWINGAGDTPGQSGAIVAAMLAVASGLCRHVLCYRTLWESSYAALVREGRWDQPAARATGMTEFLAPFGAMSAANWIAVQASHYFHRYGGDRTTLGWIAVNARANAARNPEAVYREPFTIDDYLAARLVTTPFGLYDCDVPVDGAVAVIVSAIETAADRPRPPVLVEAVGTQILERLSWDQDTLSHEPQTKGPSRHLWSRTSVRQDEVDVALLYDGFTFNAVSWLESLGFCEPGGARDFIDSGRGIALGGRLPVNPHGGQLSAGRLHGFGHVREAMLQLRGEAAGRQVPDAQIAVVTTGGGAPGGALLLRRP